MLLLIADRAVSIAGVCLRTKSTVPIEADVAAYSSFRCPEDRQAAYSSTVDIEAVWADIPAADGPVIYDNGGDWQVQTDGEGYRINLCSSGDGKIHMIARSDPDTSRVSVIKESACPSQPVSTRMMSRGSTELLDNLLVMNHLAGRGGMVTHAAGAVVNGQGLAFAGVATAGKSTLAGLLVEGGLEGSMLGDDRVIVRVRRDEDGRFGGAELWGTPWCGDLQIARNVSAPLAALFFLVKATETKAVAIDPAEAMKLLVPVVSGPWYDRLRGADVLETCGQIAENIPCYALHFKRDDEVVGLVTSGAWGADKA